MTLVSWDDIWDYQSVANTAPPDPAAVTVPSGGWTVGGQAPFGTIGGLVTDRAINTAWAVDTGLWLRKSITLAKTSPLLITGHIENAVLAYWDGEFIGAINPANAARSPTTFTMTVPESVATAGSHTLALLCLDDTASGAGDTTYIWAEVDYLPAMIAVQPQVPVKETLEWLTDTHIAEDGTEVRDEMRVAPRQMLAYRYPLPPSEAPRALHTTYGARGEEWLAPVWPQARYIGAVAADELELTVDVDNGEFRADSLVMLWQSSTSFQVLGVDLVPDATTLTLSNVTQAFTAAWLMPVRRALLRSDPHIITNGHNGWVETSYDVIDTAALSVSAPTQYNSNDIYYDEILLSGNDMASVITTEIQELDNELGLVYQRSPWTYNRVARDRYVIAENAAEAWTLREWLHRRAGRYRVFWEPSFINDLRLLSTGSLTTTIVVSSDDYKRHGSLRTHVAIGKTDGTWLARGITASTQLSPTQVQLTLSSSIAMDASDIRCISYLGLRRLDTDRVEIAWPGGGVCSTEVRTLEISP